MSVKFKVYDMETARTEFNNILDILEDNEDELNNLISALEEYSSDAVTVLTDQICEFRDMHVQMKDEMEVAKDEINEIEKSASENFKPISENAVTKIEVSEVVGALKGIGKVLDENLSQSSLSPTPGFNQWINEVDNELNDGIYEAILNPIDEAKQRRAENIYRANKQVYENAYAEFVNDMTFHTEIDYFQHVAKEIEGIDKSKFPVIMESSLYESLFEGAIGVSYNTFTEDVISKYKVDTNGIMPDTVLMQVGLGVAVGVLFGGEILAGLSAVASPLSTLLSTGYEGLVVVSKATASVLSKVGKNISFRWIGEDAAKITNNWKQFEQQLLAIGLEGGLEAGEYVPLTNSSKQMILGMALVSDTVIHAPGTIEELHDDLVDKDALEFLSDSAIEVYSPVPFTQVDDKFFDEPIETIGEIKSFISNLGGN